MVGLSAPRLHLSKHWRRHRVKEADGQVNSLSLRRTSAMPIREATAGAQVMARLVLGPTNSTVWLAEEMADKKQPLLMFGLSAN